MIIQGDALTVLKTLPDAHVNMTITSPPYWRLRDYGVAGQMGLEDSRDRYINNMCLVFDEVQRVLRTDGTCWVNLGDSYSGNSRGFSQHGILGTKIERWLPHALPPRQTASLPPNRCV